MFRIGHRIAAVFSAAQVVDNLPNICQSLEAALQQMATPATRAEGEDAFDADAITPVFKKAPPRRPGPEMDFIGQA